MQRVRNQVTDLTHTRLCYLAAPQVIRRVNRLLTGWMNYFSYGHPRRAFRQLNKHVQDRLIRHLQRRSQRGCRPRDGRSMYAHLYHHLGLVQVRTPVKP